MFCGVIFITYYLHISAGNGLCSNVTQNLVVNSCCFAEVNNLFQKYYTRARAEP